MTMIYFAWSPTAHRTFAENTHKGPVNLLVAYPELAKFNKVRHEYNVGQWFLDSGAFGVHNSGKTIDINDYIAVAKDSDAAEVAGLDVIGDPEGTRRNVEYMLEQGVDCLPTFHIGTPWEYLDWIASVTDKMAIGGIARGGVDKAGWLDQVFARIWPKKVHAFGMTKTNMLMRWPFHSADSTTYCFCSKRYGSWRGFNGKREYLGVRTDVDLWVEVGDYLKIERLLKHRWKRQMKQLEGATK